jgi:hypothetical protein
MTSERHQLITKITWGVYGAIILSMLLVLGVLFYPFCPVSYTGVTLYSQTVRPGDAFKYRVDLEKHSNKVGTISRYLVFVNDKGVQNGDATMPLGQPGPADARSDQKHKYITVEIPRVCPEGFVKIRSVVKFEYFGIRDVIITFDTPIFQVIK